MTLLALATQQDADRLFLFDEASGNSVDSMGGDPITWTGTPEYNVSGIFTGQKAIRIERDDWGNAGTAFSMGAAGATICGWVQLVDFATDGRRMTWFGSLSADEDLFCDFNRNGAGSVSQGRMRFGVVNASGNLTGSVEADTGIADGNPHFVAIRFSRSTPPRVRVDGVEQTINSISASSISTDITVLDQPLYIGDMNNNGSRLGDGGVNEFNGWLGPLAILPWRLSDDAVDAMMADSPAAITATPTLAAPYVSRSPDVTATRFAVDVTGDRRIGIGVLFTDTDDGDAVSIEHGSGNVNAKTLEASNMFNRAGNFVENGRVDDVASGTQTLVVESTTGTPPLTGFIVRAPDADSGTVLEAGSATHCGPHAWKQGGVTTFVGAQLYDGAIYAWQGTGQANGVQVFPTNEAENRYHYSACVVGDGSRLFFLASGGQGSSDGLFWARTTDNTLATLSTVTNYDPGAMDILYPRAVVDTSGSILVQIRDRQGATGSAALLTISTPWGTPSFDFDYLVTQQLYPRGIQLISDVPYTLWQAGPSPWGEAIACYRDGSVWKSLDGVTTSTGDGSAVGSPRFASTTGVIVMADATGGGTQKYMGEHAAFFHPAGEQPKVVFSYVDSDTDETMENDEADTFLAGYDGESDTLTETAITSVAAGNSYRQSGVCIPSGQQVFALLTERGNRAASNVSPDDETALYYNGWGGATLKAFKIASPYSASPVITAITAPTVTGDAAGFFAPVGGVTTPQWSYQEQHEALSATTKQGQLTLFSLPAGGGPSLVGSATSNLVYDLVQPIAG